MALRGWRKISSTTSTLIAAAPMAPIVHRSRPRASEGAADETRQLRQREGKDEEAGVDVEPVALRHLAEDGEGAQRDDRYGPHRQHVERRPRRGRVLAPAKKDHDRRDDRQRHHQPAPLRAVEPVPHADQVGDHRADVAGDAPPRDPVG